MWRWSSGSSILVVSESPERTGSLARASKLARDARYDALWPAIANGVRAAVATLVPFFLAAALGRAELGWMALGGWLGTLADPGGLRSTRLKSLATFAVLGAIMVPLAERCAGSIWLATITIGAVAFAATMARALGPAAASVGTMTAVLVAVGAAKPGSATYLADALSFAAGALWATLLSSLVWPVGPHRPVRKAIAEVFATMADYARAIDGIVEHAETGPAWAALARTQQRRVRAAIEAALAIALAVRARRPGESKTGADLRVLLGVVEAQFPKLIALSEELEALPPRARPLHVRRRLREIADTYDATRRQAVVTRPSPDGARPSTRVSQPDDDSATGILSARLVKESEHARTLAGSVGQGAMPLDAGEQSTTSAFALTELRELRDALALESVFFRHALRVAVAVTVASIIGHRFSTHPHWVTVTTLAVLQPYPGPTSTRAAERVVGTVLGSAVAAAITMTIHAPLALAAIMFPLSVAAVATKPRSYRLFTFFLTPVFVLIAEQHPGDWWTAAARAGDSVIGGAIALAAALLVWPTWERTRLPEALDAMVASAVSYRAVVLDGLTKRSEPDTEQAVAAARRAAGIAIGEAETSLERWLAEPLRKLDDGGRAMQLVTHARRMANACTALDTRAAHGLADDASREVHRSAIESYTEALIRRASKPPTA